MKKILCNILAVCMLMTSFACLGEGNNTNEILEGADNQNETEYLEDANNDLPLQEGGENPVSQEEDEVSDTSSSNNQSSDDQTIPSENDETDKGNEDDSPEQSEEPEPIDWHAVWKKDAWFYEDDSTRVWAGTLNDACAELLKRDSDAGVEKKHTIILCNEKDVLLIEKIRRKDIERFEFFIDDRIIEKATQKQITIEEVIADDSGNDSEKITSFNVKIELIIKPTDQPTTEPTNEPTDTPTDVPTEKPTDVPTDEPTNEPTDEPTDIPTNEPTDEPTDIPTDEPTEVPTDEPIDTPTDEPTGEPTEVPTEEPTQPPVELTVEAENYSDSQWSNLPVVFTMSGIPESGKYWEYAVVVYGKQIELIDGSIYSADNEGEYTIRLAMLNDLGDVVSATEIYNLMLDFTPPTIDYINNETGVNYQVEINVSDALSGVSSITLDGGQTWYDCEAGTPFVWTGDSDITIPAEMIQVKDWAGNITVWQEEVILKKNSSGGGYHGQGGSGTGEYKPHSSGTGTITHGYDQVSIVEEDEAMHVLTLDGEELELTVLLDAAEDFEYDESYEPVFKVEMASWPTFQTDEDGILLIDEEPVIDDENRDTMILDLQADEAITGDCTYRWQINGAVLRQLKNSGVRYLVLKIQDQVTVLPAEGFLAGEKYAELKMQGTSTRRFSYDVTMTYTHPEEDVSVLVSDMGENKIEDLWKTEITVSVNEESLILTEDETQEMYMVGVCMGPVDMMAVPYGTWIPEATNETDLIDCEEE